MKIIICGSISAADEIVTVKNELEKNGHEVEVPEGVKRAELRARTEIGTSEKAKDKVKYDLIRGYYEKIKLYDAVLIVNPEKRGVKGYIGGNSFLEMAFGHVLNKKLYCLNQLPDLSYASEMIAMQPIILDGDLNKLT